MSASIRLRRALLALVAAFGAVLGVPSAADAHTDIDFTLPTDGASLGEPLTEITVAFTQPVTLVGPGFEVLSPQGEVVQPFVVTDDDMVFRLQIDPPMGGGAVGVRYEVTAPDGHVISGGFSFTVSVDAPAPTTTSPPEPAPATTAAAGTAAAGEPTPTAAPAPTTVAAQVASPEPTLSTDDVAEASADDAEAAVAEPVALAGDAADDDGGSGIGLYVAIAAAVAIAAGGFLLFRRQSAS